MRALITGIVGFAGSYLAAELLESGYQVYGTQLPDENRDKLRGIVKSVKISNLDLTDSGATARYIRRIKPEVVFHLAAQSAVRPSFSNPQFTYNVNIIGSSNLLEALRSVDTLKGCLLVTTSDIYGAIKRGDLPLKETQSMKPVSPYGVSKAAVDMMGYQYFKSYGMPIVRARAFNHTGPRQNTGFVLPDFCSQVAMIEAGQQKPAMKVGNLQAEIDLSDVRDVVRGYRLLAEKGKHGEACHLCSGKSTKISYLLERVRELSVKEFVVVGDKKLLRPSDVPKVVGDYSKAKRAVGYKPEHDLEITIEDTLDYWRRVVRRYKK